MKTKSTFAVLALASTMIFGSCAEQAVKPTEVVISEGFRFNESVCPYDGGILVANFGNKGETYNGQNNDGLGYISMFKDGELSTFIPSDGYLSAPKGMLVKDGYLLICDVNKLVAYNLNELSAAPQVLKFPESEVVLNDITSNGNTIYVSVSSSGKIFTLDGSDLANLASIEPQLWCNIDGANGVLIHNSVLYGCAFAQTDVLGPENIVYKITDLNNPVPEKLIDIPNKWDGVAISEDGKTLYAGCWVPPSIYALDLETGVATLLDLDYELETPADFALFGGKLYVPDLAASTLLIKDL
ncbi:MAG: hypothetical protein R3Y15_03595 [Rikenellaceae bacterium]